MSKNLNTQNAEASGVALKNDTLWVINDGGNAAQVFLYDLAGNFLGVIPLGDITNVDWEAVSWQGDSILWIADFGNNTNTRQDLKFYKLSNLNIQNETYVLDSLSFSYENQLAFPPPATQLHFDAEAFVIKEDSLFIFSKNRSNPYNGYSYVHYLPAQRGVHETVLIDSVYTGEGPKEINWITDASYQSGDLWLLSHGYTLRFKNFDVGRFTNEERIVFSEFSQKEGFVYSAPNLYVVDESNTFFPGGNLYVYQVDSVSASLWPEEVKKPFEINHCELSIHPNVENLVFYSTSGKEIFTLNQRKNLISLSQLPKTFILRWKSNAEYHHYKIYNPCQK